MKKAVTIRAAGVGLLLLAQAALADNWDQWRGPNLNGSSSETALPERLDADANSAWKLELPGHGNGTPIVHGDRIFVSALDRQSQKLLAICVDNKSGQIAWKREVGDGFVTNSRNDMTGPSAVTDGKTVWFFYGSGDLAAFDMEGNARWARNIQSEYGQFNINWIYASSPLLYDGKLFIQVLHRDVPIRRGAAGGAQPADSYLLAVDPETGKNIFRHVRPSSARAESKEAYSTPMPHESRGRKEVIVVGADCVTGHDAQSGVELWRMGGWNPRSQGNWRVVPSPVVVGDTLVFCTPQGESRIIAFKLGGSGDISQSSKAWENTDAKSDVPVPLVYQDKLFVLDGDWRKGIFCLDPKTGKTQWSAPIASGAVFRSSPTGADGKIYVMNEQAEVWVLSAADGKILSNTTLATEGAARGSIVAAGGRVYVRTGSMLYCFEKPR